MALRTEMLPALPLWTKLLQRVPRADFMEDNQAVCKICKAGGSSKLAHMSRTHKINAASVADTFLRGIANLVYERTENEAADIGTKRFTDPMSWVTVWYLIQIVTD